MIKGEAISSIQGIGLIKGDNSDQHFNFLPFSTFSGHTLACSDACSGRTHVPTSSSKIREVAQGSSYALP